MNITARIFLSVLVVVSCRNQSRRPALVTVIRLFLFRIHLAIVISIRKEVRVSQWVIRPAATGLHLWQSSAWPA